MPRKSAISQMPDSIQDAVNEAIRENRATIDQITAMIHGMGGEVSRSAVGHYVKKANAAMERHRQMELVARQFADTSSASGDQAQMARQIITSRVNSIVSQFKVNDDGELEFDDEADELEIKELLTLSRTLKEVATSARIDAEARMKIREELKEELAAEMAALAGKAKRGDGKIDADQLRDMIRESYGV